MTFLNQHPVITSWQQFRQLTQSHGCHYLQRLDDFPNSVLIAGCQRSGTTMLARIITQSEGMVNYWFGADDELDAALILGGYVEHEPIGRYCFQTTYLDQCYYEYFEHQGDFKIIWVLRNPFSVVYSLMYNWSSLALENTFHNCGAHLLSGTDRWLFKLLGTKYISKVKLACLLYNAKVSQIFELLPKLGPHRVAVVDYDDLVSQKNVILPRIFTFIDLAYRAEYADNIHSQSLNKASRLSEEEVVTIKTLSLPVFMKAHRMVNIRK
jgi:hypothetical protein